MTLNEFFKGVNLKEDLIIEYKDNEALEAVKMMVMH